MLDFSFKDPVAAPGFYPWELLPGTLRNYYRYQGSLTTPTCNEVVLWTLFEEKSTISEYQVSSSMHCDQQTHRTGFEPITLTQLIWIRSQMDAS